jgi:hypothetical protein
MTSIAKIKTASHTKFLTAPLALKLDAAEGELISQTAVVRRFEQPGTKASMNANRTVQNLADERMGLIGHGRTNSNSRAIRKSQPSFGSRSQYAFPAISRRLATSM